MTGRKGDRYFRCTLLGSAPSPKDETDWEVYLYEAVDHVDFEEIEAEEWGKENGKN